MVVYTSNCKINGKRVKNFSHDNVKVSNREIPVKEKRTKFFKKTYKENCDE